MWGIFVSDFLYKVKMFGLGVTLLYSQPVRIVPGWN